MSRHSFRILNVFAMDSDRLSGNPLCVFEDARGLGDAQMQALALQFNLSETTFILPSTSATARVRIYTPTFEMPFAGHPTLGTAHVVRELRGSGDELRLEMKAGIIPVAARADRWTLQAQAPRIRTPEASANQFSQMLGLAPEDIGEQPLWVNTGVEQLIIPLTSVAAVRRATPNAELLGRYAGLNEERRLAYIWADAGEHLLSRFFFSKGSGIVEDPATGSATANLGGWFVATGAACPFERSIHQGEFVGRPSLLTLSVDAGHHIFVSGRVIELARGTLEL
jgi:trans-2,3-dihydro-3-hydroxyanthranilate isomerase